MIGEDNHSLQLKISITDIATRVFVTKTTMMPALLKPSNLRAICVFGQLSSRFHGSISKTNVNILKDLAISRDPKALKIEFLRVIQGIPGVSDKCNFSKLISVICVNKKNAECDLAFEMLECLGQEKPHILLLGLYDLLDKCVDCGHLNDALRVYSMLKSKNENLDASGRNRLLEALSSNCRIKDITAIMRECSVTDCDLVTISQPLIMTGNMKLFVEIFRKFLNQKCIINVPDESERVARVIRSIIYARMRRHIQCCDPTKDERSAIKDTLTILVKYHALPRHVDVIQSPSYFLMCQLHELEKARLSEKELSVYDIDMSFQKIGATGRLPDFEVSKFPFLVEGDDISHKTLVGTRTIKDLSSELKKRDFSRILLYSNAIFPDAYGVEMKQLKEKCLGDFEEKALNHDYLDNSLLHSSQDDVDEVEDDSDYSSEEEGYDSMETQIGSESDDSDDDDSDTDSDDEIASEELSTFLAKYSGLSEFMSQHVYQTARTLLPPAFEIYDITRTLERKNPSIRLQYAEEIFYFGHEPSSWPRIFMPGGFILDKSEKKDLSIKNAPTSKE